MQTVVCERCIHYRGKRRLEQLYKLQTARTNPASDEMRRREADWEAEESECLIDLLDTGARAWPSRPHVLAYCGLREEQDVFLVFEEKNAHHACADFKAVESSHSCNTCKHRAEATGYRDDRKDGDELIRTSRDLGGRDANGNFDSGWRHVREALDSRAERIDALKTSDMLMALDTGGVTPTRPRYYDTCAKYSSAGRYVVCPSRNSDGRCPGHTNANARTTNNARSRPLRWEDGGTL